MVWPPTTHQDVQDELGIVRAAHRDYFRSGYYSTGLFASAATLASALTVGWVNVRPFLVYAARSFDRIAVNVATAATAGSGGTVSLGLYEPGAGFPGPLVLETAGVSSETTGAKEFTINTTLSPGVWWVGVRAGTAASSVTGLSSFISPFMGEATVMSTARATWTVSGTTGFPATITPATTGLGSLAAVHLVSLRAA